MIALAPGLWKATVRGVPDTIVLIQGDGDGDGLSLTTVDGWWCHPHRTITDARPLITLDIDANSLAILRHSLKRWMDWTSLITEQTATRGLLDQIEAQTKPARIEEPGQWGLVNAMVFGRRSPETFLHDGTKWRGQKTASGVVTNWDSLIDPTLVRRGVES